jgi:DNA-nicking Smr family endonuclease
MAMVASAIMSSDKRRKLNEEERSLWGRITRSVAPLQRKASHAADRSATESISTASDRKPAARVRGASTLPTSTLPLEPLDRRTRQRLARGSVEIDGRLDLHGRTQREAHVALLRFLRRAQAGGARFVLVITGKGGRAGDAWSERGVLRRQVPLWLQQPEFRAYVSGFEEAHVGQGGQGALYVRLRRARSEK